MDNRLSKMEELHNTAQLMQQEIDQLQGVIADREELIADLNAFTHMVAHDLKNPLTALTGYAFLLHTRLRTSQDITVLRYLEIIDQTASRMARIIDGLLLLASVRQQDFEPEELIMAKIIEEVERRLELMAFQYHATIIKPDKWPVAIGYAPWIEEVWSNYISNGFKYGGTPPILELGATDMQNGKIRFWVKDNGNGLPPESLSDLFTAYKRIERSDHIPVEGHGLGLSIVKRIIDKLHGEVYVQSTNQPGEGCLFSFDLPKAPSANPLSQA